MTTPSEIESVIGRVRVWVEAGCPFVVIRENVHRDLSTLLTAIEELREDQRRLDWLDTKTLGQPRLQRALSRWWATDGISARQAIDLEREDDKARSTEEDPS